jgi:hypothetical protein
VTVATVELPAIEASRRTMQPSEFRSSSTGSWSSHPPASATRPGHCRARVDFESVGCGQVQALTCRRFLHADLDRASRAGQLHQQGQKLAEFGRNLHRTARMAACGFAQGGLRRMLAQRVVEHVLAENVAQRKRGAILVSPSSPPCR